MKKYHKTLPSLQSETLSRLCPKHETEFIPKGSIMDKGDTHMAVFRKARASNRIASLVR